MMLMQMGESSRMSFLAGTVFKRVSGPFGTTDYPEIVYSDGVTYAGDHNTDTGAGWYVSSDDGATVNDKIDADLS